MAWGPLVQLTTFVDIMDDKGDKFLNDGFVILDDPQTQPNSEILKRQVDEVKEMLSEVKNKFLNPKP